MLIKMLKMKEKEEAVKSNRFARSYLIFSRKFLASLSLIPLLSFCDKGSEEVYESQEDRSYESSFYGPNASSSLKTDSSQTVPVKLEEQNKDKNSFQLTSKSHSHIITVSGCGSTKFVSEKESSVTLSFGASDCIGKLKNIQLNNETLCSASDSLSDANWAQGSKIELSCEDGETLSLTVLKQLSSPLLKTDSLEFSWQQVTKDTHQSDSQLIEDSILSTYESTVSSSLRGINVVPVEIFDSKLEIDLLTIDENHKDSLHLLLSSDYDLSSDLDDSNIDVYLTYFNGTDLSSLDTVSNIEAYVADSNNIISSQRIDSSHLRKAHDPYLVYGKFSDQRSSYTQPGLELSLDFTGKNSYQENINFLLAVKKEYISDSGVSDKSFKLILLEDNRGDAGDLGEFDGSNDPVEEETSSSDSESDSSQEENEPESLVKSRTLGLNGITIDYTDENGADLDASTFKQNLLDKIMAETESAKRKVTVNFLYSFCSGTSVSRLELLCETNSGSATDITRACTNANLDRIRTNDPELDFDYKGTSICQN